MALRVLEMWLMLLDLDVQKFFRICGAGFGKGSSKHKKINTTNLTGIGHSSNNNPMRIEIAQIPSVKLQILQYVTTCKKMIWIVVWKYVIGF